MLLHPMMIQRWPSASSMSSRHPKDISYGKIMSVGQFPWKPYVIGNDLQYIPIYSPCGNEMLNGILKIFEGTCVFFPTDRGYHSGFMVFSTH